MLCIGIAHYGIIIIHRELREDAVYTAIGFVGAVCVR